MLAILLTLLVGQADGGVHLFAARMRDPKQREAAACEARAIIDPPAIDESCRVNRAIETIGPGKKAVFIVFFAAKWIDAGVGDALGHFEVFDRDGRHLDWFANNNALQPEDRLLLFTGKPAVVVQHLSHSIGCERPDEPSLLTVHLISLDKPQSAFLNVTVGPPTREQHVTHTSMAQPGCGVVRHGDVGVNTCVVMTEVAPTYTWSFTATCTSQRCTLSLGPSSNRNAAEFHWAAGSRQVSGPSGSVDGGFVRYESDSEEMTFDGVAAAHGFDSTCGSAR